MVNQARRQRRQNLKLRRGQMGTTRGKVGTDPSTVVKAILGRAPGTRSRDLSFELCSGILSEQSPIKVTPEENLVSRTENSQRAIQFG